MEYASTTPRSYTETTYPYLCLPSFLIARFSASFSVLKTSITFSCKLHKIPNPRDPVVPSQKVIGDTVIQVWRVQSHLLRRHNWIPRARLGRSELANTNASTCLNPDSVRLKLWKTHLLRPKRFRRASAQGVVWFSSTP